MSAHAFDPRSQSPESPVQRRPLHAVSARSSIVDPHAPPTPRMPYREWVDWFTHYWQPGEHLTLIGDTGSGKTTLLRQLLRSRPYVTALGVKRRDDSLNLYLKRDGFKRFPDWPGSGTADVYPRRIIWPKIDSDRDTERQRTVFTQTLNSIFVEGGWTLDLEEVAYLSDELKMDATLRFILGQARSNDISVVGPTQRPKFIPLAFYSQADHLIAWNQVDHEDAKRIGELTGQDQAVVLREVVTLAPREIFYRNKRTGFRVRTTVEV